MLLTSLKYSITIICIIMVNIVIVNAQLKDKYELKADKAAKKQDFYTAAIYYEKALSLQKEPSKEHTPYNGEVLEDKATKSLSSNNRKKLIFKIAESHRLYYNWEAAEPWYAQAATFPEEVFQTAKYWYAICLRTKANYAEASKILESFLAIYIAKDEWTKWATAELANCKFVLEKQKEKPTIQYQINKLPDSVNNKSANYAPVLLSKDTLVFTSSRNNWGINRLNIIPKKGIIKPIDPVNDVFQVSVSTMNNVKQMNIPIDAMDQGAVSFSSDKMRMYITRWKIENGQKISAIYMCTKQKNDTWTEPVILSNYINVDEYSSKQPFISSDGKYLFFSSNRPGGIGGFDLWLCILGNDGLPKKQAINLGKINTANDEEAPFYHSNTMQLFFSSNGRPGFGGFDLYVAKGTIGAFADPKNLGEPFNSPKDDVYFTSLADEPMNNAFISSDRSSTCCLEIFQVINKH